MVLGYATCRHRGCRTAHNSQSSRLPWKATASVASVEPPGKMLQPSLVGRGCPPWGRVRGQFRRSRFATRRRDLHEVTKNRR
jgi:hypothetical protein